MLVHRWSNRLHNESPLPNKGIITILQLSSDIEEHKIERALFSLLSILQISDWFSTDLVILKQGWKISLRWLEIGVCKYVQRCLPEQLSVEVFADWD